MSGELTGTLLDGRYRVRECVGKGGMGVVYRAEHNFLRRPLAVKVLSASFSSDTARVDRFFREAQAASSIRHANVIEIFDVGYTPDGAAYFVMEYLEGEDLAGCLAHEGPLAWPRARAIALQVCSAMQHVHRGGIIHRDLKPDNIFLVRQEGAPEHVKLLDFGIAKITLPGDDDDPLTRTGEVFGTPSYMAPEHLNGDPLDERADIYALGVILFKMLTGQVPFRGRDPMQILGQILLRDAPGLRDSAPDLDLPADLDAALRRAMRRDRDARFPTMEAFARALAAVAPDEPRTLPSSPRPAPPARPISTQARRTPVERVPTDLVLSQEPTSLDDGATSRHAPARVHLAPPPSPSRRWIALAALLVTVAAGATTLLLHTPGTPAPTRDAPITASPPAPVAPPASPRVSPAPTLEPTVVAARTPANSPPVAPITAPPITAPPITTPPITTPPIATPTTPEPAPSDPVDDTPVARAPVKPPRPRPAPPTVRVEDVLRQVDRAVNTRCIRAEGAYRGQQIPVDLKILADGKLVRATLPARIRDEPLGKCVHEELRRVTFPAGPEFTGSHRFVLGPAEG